MQTLRDIDLPGFTKLRSGKVREVFDLGDSLLFVATDRLSAFDVVFDDPIPGKGAVLNQISAFWFKRLRFVPNHFISANFAAFPENLQPFRDQLAGRSMLVKKTQPLAIECVVRGYLAGSGWKDYQATGSVCGHRLPAGVRDAPPLPQPIFTPATKSTSGHDINIDAPTARLLVGDDARYEKLERLSLDLYEFASGVAHQRGIVIADTKFEFGIDMTGELVLADEALTPDSSRFWPADEYEPGRSQPSFDKQFVRDYLETLDWDKKPPAPAIPPEIAAATTSRYLEAYRLLTGKEL